jgi:hypothetical protein
MRACRLIVVALLALCGLWAAEALADGGLVLSVGQVLACLPISAAMCLPVCWTEQVAIPPQADAWLASRVLSV